MWNKWRITVIWTEPSGKQHQIPRPNTKKIRESEINWEWKEIWLISIVDRGITISYSDSRWILSMEFRLSSNFALFSGEILDFIRAHFLLHWVIGIFSMSAPVWPGKGEERSPITTIRRKGSIQSHAYSAQFSLKFRTSHRASWNQNYNMEKLRENEQNCRYPGYSRGNPKRSFAAFVVIFDKGFRIHCKKRLSWVYPIAVDIASVCFGDNRRYSMSRWFTEDSGGDAKMLRTIPRDSQISENS
jgi:hypothetical protein